MLERGKNERGVIEMVDTESLVPPGHLLRQVDAAVDFEKIYKIVEPLYSEEEGRRSIDPVVLFKIVLLQHLDGNASLRGTLRRAETDIAYRWFLRYTLSEELPHFSTVSYNFRHRFTPETIEAMFQWILEEAGTAGALTPTAVFIDGTHIQCRYLGDEPISLVTGIYNKVLAQELPAEGIECVIIPRRTWNGTAISASILRRKLKNGDWTDLKYLVPETTLAFLRSEEAEAVLKSIRLAKDVEH